MVKGTVKNPKSDGLPDLEVGFEKLQLLFQAGKVPVAKDYVDLIKYTHYLHMLLGIEGDEGVEHEPQLGEGFILSDENVLSVDVPFLEIEAGNGLERSESGVLSAKGGQGIIATEDGLSLSLDLGLSTLGVFYGAKYYASNDAFIVFFTVATGVVSVHVTAACFSRGGHFLSMKNNSKARYIGIAPNTQYHLTPGQFLLDFETDDLQADNIVTVYENDMEGGDIEHEMSLKKF